MKAFIQLKENEPNNWTAIVTGDNKTGNRYNEKKVKFKGSRDRAIAHAVKTLNLDEYVVDDKTPAPEENKESMIFELFLALNNFEDDKLNQLMGDHESIRFRFWNDYKINTDGTQQVFFGKVFQQDNTFQITISQADVLYSEDKAYVVDRKDTEATFSLNSLHLCDEIKRSPVSSLLNAERRYEEIVIIRLKSRPILRANMKPQILLDEVKQNIWVCTIINAKNRDGHILEHVVMHVTGHQDYALDFITKRFDFDKNEVEITVNRFDPSISFEKNDLYSAFFYPHTGIYIYVTQSEINHARDMINKGETATYRIYDVVSDSVTDEIKITSLRELKRYLDRDNWVDYQTMQEHLMIALSTNEELLSGNYD